MITIRIQRNNTRHTRKMQTSQPLHSLFRFFSADFSELICAENTDKFRHDFIVTMADVWKWFCSVTSS